MSPQTAPREDEIRHEVKRVIATVAECSPEEIADTASFEELEIDSLLAMEVLVGVEKRYKIVLPAKEFSKIKTVNDAVAVARACLESKAREPGVAE